MEGGRRPAYSVSLLPLGAGLAAGALAGALLGGLAGAGLGWTWASDAALAAGLGLGSFIVAAAPALGLIRAAARQGSRNFGMFVVAAGGLRMILSLAVALVAYVAAGPEARTFWACFLAASLAGMVVETAWAIRVAGRVCRDDGSTGRRIGGGAAGAVSNGMTGVVS